MAGAPSARDPGGSALLGSGAWPTFLHRRLSSTRALERFRNQVGTHLILCDSDSIKFDVGVMGTVSLWKRLFRARRYAVPPPHSGTHRATLVIDLMLV